MGPEHAEVDDAVPVLVADDDAAWRLLVRTVLERNGFTVVGEAVTGDEAVILTEETEPAVVLLDVRMPGRGGVRTLEALRQEQPEVRVVACSASLEDEDATVAEVAARADGWIAKTDGPHALLKILIETVE
jgi:two-component system, chemotaxis family, chemotaxis protein CheY